MLQPSSTSIAWIAAGVLRFLEEEGKKRAPYETGGVLLGYWGSPGREVVITFAAGPGPKAKHGLMSYVPDREYDRVMIAEYYLSTGRHHTYLGDWHTHPDADSYLSYQDRRTLRQIAESPAARAPKALMAVLAGGHPWRLHVWVGSTRRKMWCVTSLETELLIVRTFDAPLG